jgi:hypothetical protein
MDMHLPIIQSEKLSVAVSVQKDTVTEVGPAIVRPIERASVNSTRSWLHRGFSTQQF